MRPLPSAPLLAGLAGALLLVALPTISSAQSLDAARAERREVQDRLDRAAERLGRAEDRVAAAEARTREAEDGAEVLAGEIAEVREGVEDQVVSLFKRGTVRDPVTVFLSSDDPQEALLRAQALRHSILGDAGEVEELGADRRRLAAVRGRLEDERASLERAVAHHDEVLADLEQDLERASELEQRLEREEAERRAAERRAREQRAAEQRASERRAPREPSSSSSATGSAPSGGSTDVRSSGRACPVAQPRSFSDTWGAPRSGGRSHRGTDILAPMGTAVHAIVDGTWSIMSPGPSAGNWAILRGRDGNHYWYLHLQSHTVGDGASVSAGQQVATNGDTGNARGTPHVHFELHPGGGSAINPYPTLRSAC